MLEFWLLIALMVITGLALLLLPLLRPPRASALVSERAALLDAHRARLRALKTQHAEGSLVDEAYRDARQELERQVLENNGSGHKTPRRRAPAWVSAGIVALVLPAISVWLYGRLGTPQAITVLEDPNATARVHMQNASSPAQMQQVADGLRARLDADSGDLEGWRLLVRARITLGEYALAVEATERALALSNGDVQDLVNYAEASSMANQMRFPEMAQTRIEQALERVPAHPRGLMLGALAAIQRGDMPLALDRLRNLLATQTPGSERARFLEGLIARVQGDAAASDPAPEGEAEDTSPGVVVQVALAPELAGEIDGNQRVFVFARAAAGPPMPLAAVALAASDLPAQVVLDDSSSMVPGRNLSSASEVVIGARVSMSGSATPSSGDLEGISAPLNPSDPAPVRVVIDRRRP